jgi:serine/threonine protein kinase
MCDDTTKQVSEAEVHEQQNEEGSTAGSFFQRALGCELEEDHMSGAPMQVLGTSSQNQIRIGERLGDLTDEVLGQGRIGVVRTLRLRGSRVQYAVKSRPANALTGQSRNYDIAVLMREAAICFLLGKAPFIASIHQVLVPLPNNKIAGTLLVSDLGDKGDLKSMMGDLNDKGNLKSPFRGPLYDTENIKTWPLRSIMLQIYLGLDHIYSKGVIHQDFNPSNIAFSGNGLIKIIDFGSLVCLWSVCPTISSASQISLILLLCFADFAEIGCAIQIDPWTREEPIEGVLAVKFGGGTPGYYSPEQEELFKQSKEVGAKMTCATCDLWQSGLVLVELHTQIPRTGGLLRSDQEAVQRCVKRKPEGCVRAFSPNQLKAWLEDIGLVSSGMKLLSEEMAQKLVECEITGDYFLNMFFDERLTPCKDPKGDVKKRRDQVFKIVAIRFARICDHLLCDISRENTILDPETGDILAKVLAPDVTERPARAKDVLALLGATLMEEGSASRHWDCSMVTVKLPNGALSRPTPHDDETIDRILGQLAEGLVWYREYRGASLKDAHDVCAEWLGSVGSWRSREKAFKAFCDLWDFTPRTALDLSRAVHVHWRPNMMADGLFERFCSRVEINGLELVDLSNHFELDAPVLKILFENHCIKTLRTLRLAGCHKSECVIPPSVNNCTNLTTLDLRESGRKGLFFGSFYLFSSLSLCSPRPPPSLAHAHVP